MSPLVWSFLSFAGAVWCLVFGYPAVLWLLSRRRSAVTPRLSDEDLPAVTLLIATLDEEARITERLADLDHTDYPPDKLRVLVVDGGSRDATVRRIRAAARAGVRVLAVPGRRGKGVQLNAALNEIEDELIVMSDADARLAPDCLRKLVEMLVSEPGTAVVGARVLPETELEEERLHWALMSRLGWLEGVVFGTAVPSGVALAFRRSMVAPSPESAADDVELALAAGCRGLRAKMRLDAVAVESRAPVRLGQFLRVRRGRGGRYREEVRRMVSRRDLPWPARIASTVRYLQFAVVPWALWCLAAGGCALALSGEHQAPLAVAATFLVSLLALASTCVEWRRRPDVLALLRWGALSMIALTTMGWTAGSNREAA